jgi:hypothetical protein
MNPNPGGSQAIPIALTGTNGFWGSMSLSATVSPIVSGGLSAVLSPTSVTVPQGGSGTSTLTVTAGQTQGAFTVTVTETLGAMSRSTQVSVSVTTGGSVAAGTLITLADGSRIPVQNLHAGMQLLSYDMTTRQFVRTVITRFVTVTVHNEMTIRTADGRALTTDQNPAQKLYVMLPDGTWKLLSVTDLKIGYKLFEPLTNTWSPITHIHYKNHGTYVMYDIYGTGPNNYIANGYLDPFKD